jgi:hypothetical protein
MVEQLDDLEDELREELNKAAEEKRRAETAGPAEA